MKYRVQLISVRGNVIDESNGALSAEGAIGLIRGWESLVIRPTQAPGDSAYCSCEKPLPTREFRTCNQCGRRISPSA